MKFSNIPNKMEIQDIFSDILYVKFIKFNVSIKTPSYLSLGILS